MSLIDLIRMLLAAMTEQNDAEPQVAFFYGHGMSEQFKIDNVYGEDGQINIELKVKTR